MPGIFQMTGTLPPLFDSVVDGGTPERRCLRVYMDPMLQCPEKSVVLPNLNVDDIDRNTRFLILSLPNNDMSKKLPFAIHKALIGIGGELRSVKRLRSGDLLIETSSALQMNSLLLSTSFLDSPLTIIPYKSLNTSRGVISEPDLLSTPEAEILEGFSDQGVIQVRRITVKKDATIIPTKHLILTFNKPKLSSAIKAGYLNCTIRPYIPNPLCCFKCQRFKYSQTSCRGQLTCFSCASVGHVSTDCSLEQKCVNCSQHHSSDSKLCSKWKPEKEIQTLKTNKNIYLEAQKLVTRQLSQTYAQITKPSIATNTTQTDENITKIKCPPLELLKPLSSVPQPNTSPSTPSVSTSSYTTQANILLSATSIKPNTQIESRLPGPIFASDTILDNSLNNSTSSLSTETCPAPTTSNKFAALQSSEPLLESATTSNNELSNASKVPQNVKMNSKNRRKHTKAQKAEIEIKMAKHKPRKSAPTEYTTYDEDMLMYDGGGGT
ncbi:putative RNA-directed DNA polymerase from transposon X-element [Trichonephila clavipes]|nr:putative RNA-directed DNA polymerase from transposon X-element [Trichonephila clavipes]